MYVDKVPNRNSPSAFLVRESYREGDKVKKRTLANISFLSPEQIEHTFRTPPIPFIFYIQSFLNKQVT